MLSGDFNPNISYMNLIHSGKLLLSEDGENFEYDRAIVEFIQLTTGKQYADILFDLQAHNNLYIHFIN
jgi:hypothetical protein